jgi:hypothetical protein
MTERDIRLDNSANPPAAVNTSILAITMLWLFIACREDLKDLGKICNLAGKGRIEKRYQLGRIGILNSRIFYEDQYR